MTEITDMTATKLLRSLERPESSLRLRAALAAGMNPHVEQVEALVSRCALEPDFFVRDMLTWALLQHNKQQVFNLVVRELESEIPQARSQALHTLSKLKDPRTWSVITKELLIDSEQEVARAAWRVAVVVVPEDQVTALADILATQFARGDDEVHRSLSRAFVALAGFSPAVVAAVNRAVDDPNPKVQAHALATIRLMDNPDEGFEWAMRQAKRAAVVDAAVVDNRV
jgi:hypothetical protein